MSNISNLKNTTWLFNNELQNLSGSFSFNIQFVSNGDEFDLLNVKEYNDNTYLTFTRTVDDSNVYAYNIEKKSWLTDYSEISIYGGDIGSGYLIDWIENNAVQQKQFINELNNHGIDYDIFDKRIGDSAQIENQPIVWNGSSYVSKDVISIDEQNHEFIFNI